MVRHHGASGTREVEREPGKELRKDRKDKGTRIMNTERRKGEMG